MITQREVAKNTGLHETYISNVINGRVNVSMSNAIKIADAYGITIYDLQKIIESKVKKNDV